MLTVPVCRHDLGCSRATRAWSSELKSAPMVASNSAHFPKLQFNTWSVYHHSAALSIKIHETGFTIAVSCSKALIVALTGVKYETVLLNHVFNFWKSLLSSNSMTLASLKASAKKLGGTFSISCQMRGTFRQSVIVRGRGRGGGDAIFVAIESFFFQIVDRPPSFTSFFLLNQTCLASTYLLPLAFFSV